MTHFVYHEGGHEGGGRCGHHHEGHEHMCGTHEGENRYSPEEALALLKYMTDHNRHHADELHELGHSLGGEAGELVHNAVMYMDMSNAKLQKALELLAGEGSAEEKKED